MIKSMTGFGSAEGVVGGARVSVEIRSVNHRFFNPSIKLPSDLAKWEGEVREAMRKAIARGHVTLFARVERGEIRRRAHRRRAVSRLRRADAQAAGAARARRRPSTSAAMLRLPNVIATPTTKSKGPPAELVEIVERALRALDQMRRAEGRAAGDYLAERLAIIEARSNRIAERAPSRLIEQRDRLRDAVRELADGVAVDEQRLAQEVAILADKLDVAEEVEPVSLALRGISRDARVADARMASANDSGFCCRSFFARRTRRAARRTTRRCCRT